MKKEQLLSYVGDRDKYVFVGDYYNGGSMEFSKAYIHSLERDVAMVSYGGSKLDGVPYCKIFKNEIQFIKKIGWLIIKDKVKILFHLKRI